MSIKSMILKWAGIDPEEIKREARKQATEQTMKNFCLFLLTFERNEKQLLIDSHTFRINDMLNHRLKCFVGSSFEDQNKKMGEYVEKHAEEAINKILASKNIMVEFSAKINNQPALRREQHERE